jgi:hypothetical protein
MSSSIVNSSSVAIIVYGVESHNNFTNFNYWVMLLNQAHGYKKIYLDTDSDHRLL